MLLRVRWLVYWITSRSVLTHTVQGDNVDEDGLVRGFSLDRSGDTFELGLYHAWSVFEEEGHVRFHVLQRDELRESRSIRTSHPTPLLRPPRSGPS